MNVVLYGFGRGEKVVNLSIKKYFFGNINFEIIVPEKKIIILCRDIPKLKNINLPELFNYCNLRAEIDLYIFRAEAPRFDSSGYFHHKNDFENDIKKIKHILSLNDYTEIMEEYEKNTLTEYCYFLNSVFSNNFTFFKTKKKIIKDKNINKGYIYVIKSEYGYKIGKTKTIKNRMINFGVKLPFNFELVFYFLIEDYHKKEIDLHNKFKSKNINGEWFNLSNKDLEYIKSELSN